MSTLQELATWALARGPDYPAVEWDKRWHNWEEMRAVAGDVVSILEASGADPLAPVALMPSNRPAVVAALIGLISQGRNIQMVHVYQPAASLAANIGQLKPAALIGMAEHLSGDVAEVLIREGIAGIRLDGMTAAAVSGAERSTIDAAPPPEELQIDLLTSGTTGPPRRFPLTYDLIVRDMVGVNSMSVTQSVDARDLPPLYFYLNCGTITGLYLQTPVLLNGRRGVLVDRFSIPTWHDYVLRYRPQSMGLPMPALQMILESDIPPEDLSSIQCIQTGAAPIDPQVHRAFEDRFGIVVQLVYGATEFGGPVAMMTMDLVREWGQRKFGSIGRAFNGAELRIVDPETGNPLRSGATGAIEVLTHRIGPDWIRTADLGAIDEDGFLWFHGRADGAINRGGFKLQPEVIEAALRLHDAVNFVSVVGVPDKRLGQVPATAIQLRPNVPAPSIRELEEHLRRHVETTHIPAKWRFVDALPYTSTMKVNQAAVRALFETSGAT